MKKTFATFCLLSTALTSEAAVKLTYQCSLPSEQLNYNVYESEAKSCTVAQNCSTGGVVEIIGKEKTISHGTDIYSGGKQVTIALPNQSRIYINFNNSEANINLDGKFPEVKIDCEKVGEQ